MEGEAVLQRDELAFLGHGPHEIRPDLREQQPELLEARRHEIDRDDAHDEADEGGQGQEGPQQALRRHAAGAHDDQFGIPVQPVQRVEGRQEQGDRRDHADEGRQGQAGDRQEDEKRLPLAGQEVELAKGLRDPDHAREGDQARGEGTECDFQDVSFEKCHEALRPRAIKPWVSCHMISGKTAVFNSPRLRRFDGGFPVPASVGPKSGLHFWDPSDASSLICVSLTAKNRAHFSARYAFAQYDICPSHRAACLRRSRPEDRQSASKQRGFHGRQLQDRLPRPWQGRVR